MYIYQNWPGDVKDLLLRTSHQLFPPLSFVYTSRAPAAFSSRLAGAYHDLHITNSARHTPTSKPHPAPHPAPIPPYLNAEAQCATKGLTLPLSRSGMITLNLYRTEKGNCNDLQGGIGGCGTGCDGLTGLKRLGTWRLRGGRRVQDGCVGCWWDFRGWRRGVQRVSLTGSSMVGTLL